MTVSLRNAGIGALIMLMVAFMLVGVSSPVAAQEDCYPVPPGGCPTPEPPPPPAPPPPAPPPPAPPPAATPLCEDIIQAIADGDTSMDQNGDGEINADDLPADCTCAELVDAVAAGTLDPADLGALSSCCQELIDAIVAGDIDPDDLPDDIFEDCDCDEIQQLVDAGALSEDALEDCEPPLPAEGGIDASGMALIAMVTLMGGATVLAVTRRSSPA